MLDLTSLQRDILYCIADLDDPYGLGIRRALEEYRGTNINHGRIYPDLDKLVNKGYLSKNSTDGKKNNYELTAKGVESLVARQEWERKRVPATPVCSTPSD